MKLADKKHLTFQSKSQPVFTFRIFGNWPTKKYVTEIAVRKFLGVNASQYWNSMHQLFAWLISDIERSKQEMLLKEYKKSLLETNKKDNSDRGSRSSSNRNSGAKVIKNGKNHIRKLAKLDSTVTAYEYGYKYVEWILRVKL